MQRIMHSTAKVNVGIALYCSAGMLWYLINAACRVGAHMPQVALVAPCRRASSAAHRPPASFFMVASAPRLASATAAPPDAHIVSPLGLLKKKRRKQREQCQQCYTQKGHEKNKRVTKNVQNFRRELLRRIWTDRLTDFDYQNRPPSIEVELRPHHRYRYLMIVCPSRS